jgi:hypothetical protein
MEPTPSKSEGDLDLLEPPSEDQPIQADPIQVQKGSDPIQAEPEKKREGRVRRIVQGIAGFWMDRRPPEGKPVKKTQKLTPEPIEQSGEPAAAADAPHRTPPGEEQPRTIAPVVTDVFTAQNPPPSERGETWAEVHGLPEPEDNGFVQTLFWKSCKPGPDGQWFYRDELMSVDELLAQPGARMARITAEDLTRR